MLFKTHLSTKLLGKLALNGDFAVQFQALKVLTRGSSLRRRFWGVSRALALEKSERFAIRT